MLSIFCFGKIRRIVVIIVCDSDAFDAVLSPIFIPRIKIKLIKK